MTSDRAQRLRGARAEACEAAACVEAIGRLGLAHAGEIEPLLGSPGKTRRDADQACRSLSTVVLSWRTAYL